MTSFEVARSYPRRDTDHPVEAYQRTMMLLQRPPSLTLPPLFVLYIVDYIVTS